MIALKNVWLGSRDTRHKMSLRLIRFVLLPIELISSVANLAERRNYRAFGVLRQEDYMFLGMRVKTI